MLKHSGIYAVGNISRQLVGFLMLPIYTHYLTPADYGVVGLLIFVVSLFEIILGGHMFQAVPKYYHQSDNQLEKQSVVSTTLFVTTAFSSLSCGAMFLFSDIISENVFGDRNYSIYISIFSFLILTHAFEQYGLTYLRIIKKPWTFFAFSMTKLFMQLTLNIVTIVYLEMGLMGVAVSSLISSTAIAILLLIYTIRNTGIRINPEIAKKVLVFSWPLWASGLVGLYIGSSNRYFIRIFTSLDEVGLFELAAKFGSIVSVLVWLPFSQYWQTERFNIAKSSNPYPAYNQAFKIILILLTVSGLGVILTTDIIIKHMSDEDFYPASQAVPFLVVASLFQCLTIFNNFSFMHTEKTFEVTKNNLVTAIVITALYFAFIPEFGFIGASAAFALGSIIQYQYALYSGNKIYPLKIPRHYVFVTLFILLIVTFANQSLIVDFDLSGQVAAKLLVLAFASLASIISTLSKPELIFITKKIKNSVKKN